MSHLNNRYKVPESWAREKAALVGLPCAPTEIEKLDLDTARQHRFFACRYYARCLDFAALLFWPSFTCSLCPLFQETDPDEPKI